MKVLLINGRAHEKNCTYTALKEVADAIEKEGIETEIFHVGNKPISGCIVCDYCKRTRKNRCSIDTDSVNEALEKSKEADGFIFGSPVHFASASGAITSFMDRIFRAGIYLEYKPAAAVVSCRRGGATSTFDQLNKYFTIRNMPVVSSQYWNMVHGNTPDEVRQDLEGMQTMRTLGRNMAWMLKCIEAGKAAGISIPVAEKPIVTNFIR